MAVVVLLGGGGGALFLALRGDDGPPPSPNPPPTVAAPTSAVASPSPTPLLPTTVPTGDPRERLSSRDTDPQPLTLDELFEKKEFTVDGRKYTRAARQQDKNCAKGVEGAAIRTALRAGDCTQVLRASYVGRNGKVISTLGVMNLKDAAAAEKAFDAGEESSNHIKPLRGSGPAQNLGIGRAVGSRITRGHYLIMTWVQYADGHKPSSTKDKKLVQHDEDVFETTIVSALVFRRLMGEPRP